MCFKAMKSSGFDIEGTHLTDLARLEKLVLSVMAAFVWCYKVGIYLNSIRPIKVKKHGRKAKSIFRYGLDYISNCLLNAMRPMGNRHQQIFVMYLGFKSQLSESWLKKEA